MIAPATTLHLLADDTAHTAESSVALRSPANHYSTGASFRFTRDGSVELEQHLAAVCRAVHHEIQKIIPAKQLQGILLAGGYGRGEGGVLRTPEGDRCYNDMEFYVMVRGSTLLNDRRYRTALHQLGHRLSESAGLEVEFKIQSLQKLRRSPVSMFSYDYVTRHHWVLGSDWLLKGCEHHENAASIPLHEATRLLFNRCSGLLYATERLQRKDFNAEDADFVGRNLAKARLGIGDALLAAAGAYHWSCTERQTRLKKLCTPFNLGARLEGLAVQHQQGVRFKLHPERSTLSREALQGELEVLRTLARQAWLLVEGLRLHEYFMTAEDYAHHPASLCPEQPAWRNRLVNARTFGARFALTKQGQIYPRERLFRALALLLWSRWERPAPRALLQQLLSTDTANLPGLVRAYEILWHRFN